MKNEQLNKIVKNVIEIFIFIVFFVIGLIGGTIVGIYIAMEFKNYFLLSYVVLIWIMMIKDISFKRDIKRREKIVSRYPHVIKLMLKLVMIITIILSWVSFIAFVLFILSSNFYFTLERALKEGLI